MERVVEHIHRRNTIYLMHAVATAYARSHHLSRREFDSLDDKYQVLRYVSACPSAFDALPEALMVKEVDDYVRRRS